MTDCPQPLEYMTPPDFGSDYHDHEKYPLMVPMPKSKTDILVNIRKHRHLIGMGTLLFAVLYLFRLICGRPDATMIPTSYVPFNWTDPPSLRGIEIDRSPWGRNAARDHLADKGFIKNRSAKDDIVVDKAFGDLIMAHLMEIDSRYNGGPNRLGGEDLLVMDPFAAIVQHKIQ